MRRWLRRGLLVLGLAIVLYGIGVVGVVRVQIAPPHLSQASQSTDRQYILDQVNAARADKHQGALAVAPDAQKEAQAWADHMATNEQVADDPRLGSTISNWCELGENAGSASSVEEIFSAWMDSSEHRDNILHPTYRDTGIGVSYRNGTVYVVQIFVRRCPMSSSPKPVQPHPGSTSTPSTKPSRCV